MNPSVCWDCCYCVADAEEPHMWMCELDYLALSDKHECNDREKKT